MEGALSSLRKKVEEVMKKYKLIDMAKGKLRTEDKCGAFRLTRGCDDMFIAVSSIYADVGL